MSDLVLLIIVIVAILAALETARERDNYAKRDHHK